MKTLFTAEASSNGGRSGTITSPDGLLNITLGNPLKPGEEKKGPNPELLFAGAYSTCYHGAFKNAAKKLNVPSDNSKVSVKASLLEDDKGGYHIGVELHAEIPGQTKAKVKEVMEAAHVTCPYSKLMRGEAKVTLVADGAN